MTNFASDFVLTAQFVEDHHLQICLGDKVLATVCEPAGNGFQSEFAVWDGDGMDPETDEETRPLKRFYTKDTQDVNRTWREAVAYAYSYAGMEMIGIVATTR